MTGEKIKTTDIVLIFVTFAGVTLILLGIETNPQPKMVNLPEASVLGGHKLNNDVTIQPKAHIE